MISLAAAAGGAAGAILRYYISALLNKKYPYGTFMVNIAGSFCLGLIAGMSPSVLWKTFLGAGVMGGLTTFSTLQLETLVMYKQSKRKGLFYLAGSTIIGLAAFAAGYAIVS
jgi:CrcB protein